jgi:excinuclease UvrABC nuclease subunit
VLDNHARTLFLAAASDLRALALQRLAPGTELARAASRLLACPVGSALEADLVLLDAARAHLPHLARALTDTARAWFVHLDPDSPTPLARKTDALREPGLAPHSLLGPLPNKDAAGRYAKALDDAFDLCRYPRELAAAPRGRVCAYFEMHRCPGPCAGHEPMPAFRARVRDALATLATGHAADSASDAERSMHAAAAAHQFEAAAALRHRAEALRRLAAPAFRHTGPLNTLALLLILPSERRGWARVLAFAAGQVVPIAEVRSEDSARHTPAALADLVTLTRSHLGRAFPAGHEAPPALERLGVITRHWFRPAPKGRRRRPTILDLRRPEEALTPRTLAAALRAAAWPTGKADPATPAALDDDRAEFDAVELDAAPGPKA